MSEAGTNVYKSLLNGMVIAYGDTKDAAWNAFRRKTIGVTLTSQSDMWFRAAAVPLSDKEASEIVKFLDAHALLQMSCGS